MPEFRYVICDVFTDRPLEGNPLAVFTDARADPGGPPPAARPGNTPVGDRVLLPGAGDRPRAHPDLHPGHELPFAGHPVLGSAFVLAAPLQLPEIVLETGVGPVPVRLERDGPRIVFGRMVQPVPRVEAVADPAPAASGRSGSSGAALPVELYDNGPRHLCVALDERAGGGGPPAGHPGAGAPLPARHDELLRGGGPALEDACLCARAPASRKTRPPAPPPGRSPATWRATAASLSGEEIEIRQGAEIGRPSVLFARADGSAGGDRARRGGRIRGDRGPRRVPAAGLIPERPGDAFAVLALLPRGAHRRDRVGEVRREPAARGAGLPARRRRRAGPRGRGAGRAGLGAIVEEFGPDVVRPDGQLDRKRLGALVFADPARRKALEAITHPAILARRQAILDTWAAEGFDGSSCSTSRC